MSVLLDKEEYSQHNYPQSRKQALTDYFLEWRRGRWRDYDADKRHAEIANTWHPKSGGFQGLVDPFLLDPHLCIRRARRGVRRQKDPEHLSNQRLEHHNRAQQVADELSDQFSPARFTYQGIVGYGGFGVAVRFDMTDGRGDRRSIVVKTDMRELGSSIKREREFAILMAGAEHIVQRILLAAMPPAASRMGLGNAIVTFLGKVVICFASTLRALKNTIVPSPDLWPKPIVTAILGHDPDPFPLRQGPKSWWPEDSALETRRLLDRRQSILVLEWCKHGDLRKWIDKMAERRSTERFSEKVLWLIFECLWKGSIALAYPRAFSPWPLNPRIEQVPLKSESMRRAPPDDPVVHFDLDASNVFVGDFGEQYDVPIVKIADLGVAMRPWEENVASKSNSANEQRIWEARLRGKRPYYAPEQSTEAWDYIADLDSLEWSTRNGTAGNYWSHTNVYQIGAVMFELLTLDLIDVPSIPREYAFHVQNEDLSGWTYGWRLLADYDPSWEENSASTLLRQTIAWCMEHIPSKRPSLDKLGDIIQMQIKREWPDESDVQTKQWAEDFFGEPAEKSLHTAFRSGNKSQLLP